MLHLSDFLDFYADSNDPAFYADLRRKQEFSSLQTHRIEVPKGRYLPHQEWMARFLSPLTPYDGVLACHGVGTGKTALFTAVTELARQQRPDLPPSLIVTRPSKALKHKAMEEIAKYIPKYAQLTPEDESKIEKELNLLKEEHAYSAAREAAVRADKRFMRLRKNLSKHFDFQSYSEWDNDIKLLLNEVNQRYPNATDEEREAVTQRVMRRRYGGRYIIIDEAHNLRPSSEELQRQYSRMKMCLQAASPAGAKIVLLTATPMREHATEIVDLINLLHPANHQLSYAMLTEALANPQLATELKNQYFRGKVSYLRSQVSVCVDVKGIPVSPLEYTRVQKLQMHDEQASRYYKAYAPEAQDIAEPPEQPLTEKEIPSVKKVKKSALGVPMTDASDDDDTKEDDDEDNDDANVSVSTTTEKEDNEALANQDTLAASLFAFDGHAGRELEDFRDLLHYDKHNKPILFEPTKRVTKVASMTPRTASKKSVRLTVAEEKHYATIKALLPHPYIDLNDNRPYEKMMLNQQLKDILTANDAEAGDDVDLRTKLREKNLQELKMKYAVSFKTTVTAHEPRQRTARVELGEALRKFLVQHDVETSARDTLKARLVQLRKLSVKYHFIIRQLLNNQKQKMFVFGNLVNGSGLMMLSALLPLFGYSRLTASGHEGAKPRFCILTGESEDSAAIDKYLKIFNHPENNHGEVCQLMIGSGVIGEGVDLMAIRKIFIVEGWWNEARVDQAIGRGIRFGSHAMLPPAEQQVDIYRLVAYPSTSRKRAAPSTTNVAYDKFLNSIDLAVYKTAEDKERLIQRVMRLLKESAVDCGFNTDRNMLPTDSVSSLYVHAKNKILTLKPSTLITRIGNNEVIAKHLEPLMEVDGWLNNDIINAYIELLLHSYESKHTYILNSFFFTKLRLQGLQAMKRWIDKMPDFTTLKRVLIPIHVGENHWTLAEVDLVTKEAKYYNSLPGGLPQDEQQLFLSFLQVKLPSVKFTFVQTSTLTVPQQDNNFDCGVFMLSFITHRMKNEPIQSFDQSQAQRARQKLLLSLLNPVVWLNVAPDTKGLKMEYGDLATSKQLTVFHDTCQTRMEAGQPLAVDVDFSKECNFDLCEYQCDGITKEMQTLNYAPKEYLTDTYVLHYAEQDEQAFLTALIESAFKRKNAYDFQELHELLSVIVPRIPFQEIHMALLRDVDVEMFTQIQRRAPHIERYVLTKVLFHLITYNHVFVNRLGFANYLRTDRNMYFLVDDPWSGKSYTSAVYADQPMPMDVTGESIEVLIQQRLNQKIIKVMEKTIQEVNARPGEDSLNLQLIKQRYQTVEKTLLAERIVEPVYVLSLDPEGFDVTKSDYHRLILLEYGKLFLPIEENDEIKYHVSKLISSEPTQARVLLQFQINEWKSAPYKTAFPVFQPLSNIPELSSAITPLLTQRVGDVLERLESPRTNPYGFYLILEKGKPFFKGVRLPNYTRDCSLDRQKYKPQKGWQWKGAEQFKREHLVVTILRVSKALSQTQSNVLPPWWDAVTPGVGVEEMHNEVRGLLLGKPIGDTHQNFKANLHEVIRKQLESTQAQVRLRETCRNAQGQFDPLELKKRVVKFLKSKGMKFDPSSGKPTEGPFPKEVSIFQCFGKHDLRLLEFVTQPDIETHREFAAWYAWLKEKGILNPVPDEDINSFLVKDLDIGNKPKESLWVKSLWLFMTQTTISLQQGLVDWFQRNDLVMEV